MTSEPTSQPADTEPTARPHDVDTGFWLWAGALPLMAAGYLIGAVATPGKEPSMIVVAFSVIFVVVPAGIVVTFLILMLHGYRWARTLLTGGGLAAIINAAVNLFGIDLPPVAAVAYAVVAIVGSVLIAGGIYLLHRKDAQGFFTR